MKYTLEEITIANAIAFPTAFPFVNWSNKVLARVSVFIYQVCEAFDFEPAEYTGTLIAEGFKNPEMISALVERFGNATDEEVANIIADHIIGCAVYASQNGFQYPSRSGRLYQGRGRYC